VSGLRNRKRRVLAPLADLLAVAILAVLGGVPTTADPQGGQVAAWQAAIASSGGTPSVPHFRGMSAAATNRGGLDG
jgi:hypothetical protein